MRRAGSDTTGTLDAVKLKDLTARQGQKALAGLSASLPAALAVPPLLSTRLTRSLAQGDSSTGSRQLTGVAVA